MTIRLEAVKKVLDDAIKSKGSHSVAKLDASQVNVLKGAAAVIFLFDPRKLSGWHYIKRELPKVPKNIDVLVLVCLKFGINSDFLPFLSSLRPIFAIWG